MTLRKKQRGQSPRKDEVLSDPNVQAWAQLAHAYHRIARRMELELAPDGLTLAQFEILVRLQFDGVISQSALADRLLVTKGNISGLLNRMAVGKLVDRTPDPDDRRAHQLTLTKRGRQLFAKTFPKHLALIRKVLGELSPTQVKMMRRLLSLLPHTGEGEFCCG